ncbi:hypothetical protein KAF80_26590, partial [Bacillus sp. WL1]|uniref:hypothetical protein n=1 Tax=Bacillus sp. WL1 TaxID=2822693 RepID=UPI001B31CEA9
MNKKCPNCGSREIRQDSLNAQACLRLISTNNLFNQFSRVIADVCTYKEVAAVEVGSNPFAFLKSGAEGY